VAATLAVEGALPGESEGLLPGAAAMSGSGATKAEPVLS